MRNRYDRIVYVRAQAINTVSENTPLVEELYGVPLSAANIKHGPNCEPIY